MTMNGNWNIKEEVDVDENVSDTRQTDIETDIQYINSKLDSDNWLTEIN